MAVNVNYHLKPGAAETGAKATATIPPIQKAQSKDLFQALLDGLKPKEQSQQIGKFQNRPASSEIIKRTHHKTSGHAKHAQTPNQQNVNNLAASTLLALTAISSGPNHVSGLSPTSGTRHATGAVSSSSSSSEVQDAASRLIAGREIGSLSAQFESGEKGPDIIGFDGNGGTSYGTFQISSRAGTMHSFLDYLSDKAPDIAGKLKAAGPANTGSRSGRMPAVWKQITAQDPERFSKLQNDFIEKTHYLPALQEISEKTGLDISKTPKALQEVLWSTAVQHGPKGAAKILTRAVERAQTKDGGVKLSQVIGSVYAMRAGQFGSSAPDVKSAVRNRFKEESQIALAMLSDPLLKSDGVRA